MLIMAIVFVVISSAVGVGIGRCANWLAVRYVPHLRGRIMLLPVLLCFAGYLTWVIQSSYACFLTESATITRPVFVAVLCLGILPLSLATAIAYCIGLRPDPSKSRWRSASVRDRENQERIENGTAAGMVGVICAIVLLVSSGRIWMLIASLPIIGLFVWNFRIGYAVGKHSPTESASSVYEISAVLCGLVIAAGIWVFLSMHSWTGLAVLLGMVAWRLMLPLGRAVGRRYHTKSQSTDQSTP